MNIRQYPNLMDRWYAWARGWRPNRRSGAAFFLFWYVPFFALTWAVCTALVYGAIWLYGVAS